MIINTGMNSRFDQAVEQILKEHVVEAAGMASLPGAQPEPEKRGFLRGLVNKAASATASGIKTAADWTANKVAQGAAIATGFTPGVGSSVYSGTIAAAKAPIGGVRDAWRERNLPAGSSTSSGTSSSPTKQSSATPTTTPSATQQAQQPGSTALRELIVQPQTIDRLSRQFGGTTPEQAKIKASLTTILPTRPGTYRSQVPVGSVWSAVMAAADKTQRGAPTYADVMKPVNVKNFETNLQSELNAAKVDPNDASKLKRNIPTFLQTIPASTPKQTVDSLFSSLG
jgi:hypothetical protein